MKLFFSGLTTGLAIAAVILSDGLLIPVVAAVGLAAQIFGTQKSLQRNRQLIVQTVEVSKPRLILRSLVS